MEENKHIRDGIVFTVLYIAMLLFMLYFPSAIFIVVLLLPIPIIMFASRHNQQHLVMLIGAISLIVFLLSVIIGSMLFTPFYVLSIIAGFAIGRSVNKQGKAYDTWIQGIIGYVIGLLFVYIYTQLVFDINWSAEIDLAIERVFENISFIVNQVESLGPTDQINDQLELLREQMGMIKDLLPAGIAIAAISMGFLTQWISYRLINMLDHKSLRFPPARKLKFPVAIIWFYILAILITIFESNPSSGLFIGAQNIISLTGFLMILQGFTFVFFYAHHKNKSNVLPVLVIVFSLVLPLLLYVIRLVGLIDIAFSLRDRMEKSKGRS